MNAAALLLLADSRLPAGGHAHSGGTEQAVRTGAVHDVASLRAFLVGRLRTTGLVAAALTAAACRTAGAGPADGTAGAGPADGTAGVPGDPLSWAELDAEADAVTASPAQRDAARHQGRLLLRVARRIWPSQPLEALALAVPHPHHPVALGAAAHAAGVPPEDAATAAAYHAVSGPATAAVRLLGLDPVEVHRLLAGLAPDLESVAERAARADPLPAPSAPALDLLAERHAQAGQRLFVS
ncbi:urease accessory UreF family protein [Nonomuraea sp. NPDC049152]|uniref:urease accessory protein UreF n=1 Tax=Nonomuraea sp. NPDC049152 TaxID=3154350 RepID=UPI0033C29AA6